MSDSATRAAELRLSVAEEHGLTGHAHRLQGDTKAELEADAKQLAQALGVGVEPEPSGMDALIRRKAGIQPAASSAPAPVASFDGGARSSTQPAPDMNDLIREASGHAIERRGR